MKKLLVLITLSLFSCSDDKCPCIVISAYQSRTDDYIWYKTVGADSLYKFDFKSKKQYAVGDTIIK